MADDGNKKLMAEPDEMEETIDHPTDDRRVRKQVGWVFLVGAALTTCVLIYDVVAGVVHGRSGEARRDTDPQMFWLLVCGYGVGVIIMLAVFAASRKGDGRNED